MEVILTALASIFRPDERFIMHRYSSTRMAMIVGIVLIVGWFNYELIVKDVLRWDLAIIAAAMAITKVLTMVYLQATQ
jgi:hypothetical protein